MPSQEIHKGDIGTALTVEIQENEVAVPIDTAETIKIILKKPTGEVLIKDAAFVTDGSDGQIRYVTVAGDLDCSGEWKIQGKVVMPSGTWNSEVDKFEVYDNI